MSGHSHWATIKHKKASLDARRGKHWSKLARNIIVAAKHGGGDPDANLALRYAIDKAKGANMPKDTIDKAIKKGTGELGGASFESVTYEGYGPAGVAVMCEVLTDNRHRTAPEIKKIFERCGGNLGTTNCVAWMFAKKGLFTVPAAGVSEDKIMEIALDAGADDCQLQGDVWQITCALDAYERVKAAIAAAGLKTQVSELSMEPSTYVTLDSEAGRKALNLMEALEDHDDVQNVYSNFELSDTAAAEVAVT